MVIYTAFDNLYHKKYLFHEKAMGYLDKDVEVNSQLLDIYLPLIVRLLYLLHNNSYFRSLFYYRIGYVYASLIGWYRPGDKYFIISKTLEMRGGGVGIISSPIFYYN